MNPKPRQETFRLAAICAIALSILTPGYGDNSPSLDSATGMICKADPERRTFELLKETEYDPKTDLTRSRFTVFWSENTKIIELSEAENFTNIPAPVFAVFHGIDPENLQAAKEGRAFLARVATLHLAEPGEPGIDEKDRIVRGWFTPESSENPRSGIIKIGESTIPVSMRPRHARIHLRRAVEPASLATGFWKTKIHGEEQSPGRFMIDLMELTAMPDPRKTDDRALPRVLVIGDSISMNYHDAARDALAGIANYHRIDGNSFSTEFGVANAGLWLGEFTEPGLHWDVIQLNHGLHDLKQKYDEPTDTFGEPAITPDDYRDNLEKIITILRKTGATLIWCSTTPVPNHNKGTYARRQGAEIEYNNAALEVMRRHPDILINDLHHAIASSPVFDNWRKQNDVHFYRAEEREVLGRAVAAKVREALAARASANQSPNTNPNQP